MGPQDLGFPELGMGAWLTGDALQGCTQTPAPRASAVRAKPPPLPHQDSPGAGERRAAGNDNEQGSSSSLNGTTSVFPPQQSGEEIANYLRQGTSSIPVKRRKKKKKKRQARACISACLRQPLLSPLLPTNSLQHGVRGGTARGHAPPPGARGRIFGREAK